MQSLHWIVLLRVRTNLLSHFHFQNLEKYNVCLVTLCTSQTRKNNDNVCTCAICTQDP